MDDDDALVVIIDVNLEVAVVVGLIRSEGNNEELVL